MSTSATGGGQDNPHHFMSTVVYMDSSSRHLKMRSWFLRVNHMEIGHRIANDIVNFF